MDPQKIAKQLQIPRDVAVRLGQEAVHIIEAGKYKAQSGRVVEIGPLVEHAVNETRSYPPDSEQPCSGPGSFPTSVKVQNETTLTAARRMREEGCIPAALNMASATSPGGGFRTGARAQEEYLCRSSALWACLRDSPMYAFHRSHTDPFYSDYVIYSPDVPVFRDDDSNLLDEIYLCCFITSPAVHAIGVSKYMPLRQGEIVPTMKTRIHKVLSIAAAHHHTHLVLGAWGCGAFGNDGAMIASLFRSALDGEFRGLFKQVVFAITDWSDDQRFIGPFASAFA